MNKYLRLVALNITTVIFFGSIVVLIMGYINNNVFNYNLLLICIVIMFIIIYLARGLWNIYNTLKK